MFQSKTGLCRSRLSLCKSKTGLCARRLCLFKSDTSLFWNDTSLFCNDTSLFWSDTSLFCDDTRLFWSCARRCGLCRERLDDRWCDRFGARGACYVASFPLRSPLEDPLRLEDSAPPPPHFQTATGEGAEVTSSPPFPSCHCAAMSLCHYVTFSLFAFRPATSPHCSGSVIALGSSRRDRSASGTSLFSSATSRTVLPVLNASLASAAALS
jgi:hypothetical protein